MAFLTIHFSHERRQRLGSILQIVSWACILCGVALVCLGIFINLHVQAKINLIEGYDSSALPKMLVIVGSLVVVLDLVCGKICQDISDHRRIHRYQILLFPMVILLFALDVCVLTTGCMCFAHRSQLSHSIHDGLMTGMLRYKDNLTYKFEIDELQMEFKCCGNNAYQDWFNIQWINTKYLNINDERIKSKMATGVYLNDDVPFSCCITHTTRACIHHHITDSDMHFNYQYPTDMTIYPIGCRDQLIEYFSKKLKNIGTVSLAVFGLQFIIVICLRYLQTSIANAGKTGNPKADAPGWLFDKAAGKEDNSGDNIAHLEAQNHQREQDDYSDDFESDHFSDDDDDWGGGGGGDLNEPIYENLPLLDQGNKKEGKSKKDKKSDKNSKKEKGSKKKNDSKKKQNDSKKQTKNNKQSSKKSPSKKGKSSTQKNKSPTSKKTKSPASQKTKSAKAGGSKGMKKPKKGGGKMPGKKKGRMNKNRHNNCDQLSSSSSGYTSSDGYETDVDLPVGYYVNEMI